MNISTAVCWRLVWAGAAVGVLVSAWGKTQSFAQPQADSKPVSVASFAKQMPEGYLGVPLGTVVRVTGETLDDGSRSKSEAGKTLLRINTVNGKPLAKPVVFQFCTFRHAAGLHGDL